MTKAEFDKLVIDYGDACFDCGEWQHDRNTNVDYEELFQRSQAARTAVLEAYKPWPLKREVKQ